MYWCQILDMIGSRQQQKRKEKKTVQQLVSIPARGFEKSYQLRRTFFVCFLPTLFNLVEIESRIPQPLNENAELFTQKYRYMHTIHTTTVL